LTASDDDCASITITKAVLGFGLPVLLDATLLRLTAHDLFLPWVGSAIVGFLFLTRRCPTRMRALIAVGYFPLMILIFFFGSLFVPFLAVSIHE
jgi:hypothetical protein